MGACLECQFEVPGGAPACPRCGTAQLASFDVPDLDLPAAPAPAPKKAKGSVRAAPPRLELGLDPAPMSAKAADPATFQASLPGLDDDDIGGPQLEIEVAPVRPARPVSVRPPPPAERGPGQPGSGRERAGGRSSVHPPRRASGAPADEGDLDSYELKQVARFGALPAHPWESVLYALRVLRRLGELKAEIPGADAGVKAHEKSLEDALVEFIDQARGALSKDAAMARVFEPAQEAQSRYDARLGEIEALDAQGQAELAAIDQEILACERTTQEGRSTKEGLSSEAARLFDASRQGDPLATQILEKIRDQMQMAEGEATRAIAQTHELRRRRREIEQQYVARLADMDGDLKELDRPRREQLIEIGRGLIERRTSIEHEAFAPVEVARKKLAEAVRRRRLLGAALTAYDRPKVIEGALYLVGAVALLVGLVVLGVMRMNRELSAPPPVLPPG